MYAIRSYYEKAMLVTNVGGLAEIVPHQKTGYVVDPNPDAIADALVDFYENKRQCEFENQIPEVKKQFSWTKMAETFINLLTQLS